jgi:hypothetical protein
VGTALPATTPREPEAQHSGVAAQDHCAATTNLADRLWEAKAH